MKILLFALFTITSGIAFGQNNLPCQEKEIFSPLPNHEMVGCEDREFDSFPIYFLDAQGNRNQETKEGQKIVTYYRWQGNWDDRPSKAMIFKNYQNAVEKLEGELLYSGSAAYFHFEKSGNKYWMEVNSDGSGDYSVTVIREDTMTQYVSWTAKEINKAMAEDGQVSFYGILFDTDQATLRPESEDTLKEIATFLKENPQIKVYLVGHTDNTGNPEHNLSLSKRRAEATVQYLIQKHEVPESQVKPEGVGELSPVASNLSEEGKAKNRRVVMVLRK
ncbi:MAG: OmpA family protein [Cytophagales bacterium]|nr:MAG: OmpA family protein [Cytophagales bacterium]